MDSKQNILIRFGERVREERLKKGLSQEDLAFRADLHRTYIGMIERAEKNITLINICKICDALEIPLKEIFEFNIDGKK
ncbi:MAG: helix-turn-helix transcriptional regulator [Bacteroidetes bacterium]|nr:helix-turn-helix transcriptional regulator [Bacteroidota bacterium]